MEEDHYEKDPYLVDDIPIFMNSNQRQLIKQYHNSFSPYPAQFLCLCISSSLNIARYSLVNGIRNRFSLYSHVSLTFEEERERGRSLSVNGSFIHDLSVNWSSWTLSIPLRFSDIQMYSIKSGILYIHGRMFKERREVERGEKDGKISISEEISISCWFYKKSQRLLCWPPEFEPPWNRFEP